MPKLLRSVVLAAAILSGDAAIAGDWPTHGWQTSTPEEQGMTSSALAGLIDLGARQSMDSVLIVRHGRIVLDAYYAPYTAEMPHVVNSVTKAVVGTLAAMAIKDGLLPGAEETVLSFFADRSVENLDDRKKAITLQNLFDMTSGFAWQEGIGSDVMQSVIDMERSRDWIEFVLSRPMAAAPGERFYYDSGNPHLVSAILTKTTRMSTEDYARQKLFGPLGITTWTWRRDPQDVSTGGYGLSLYPRDMAKFGYLYLRNGVWGDTQLVPPDWVDRVNHAAVDMKLSFAPAWRYGNFFWAYPDHHFYWASGYHCQLIIVMPAQDVVAVTTGRDNCRMGLLEAAIKEAVVSDTALPPDPAGTERLAAAVRAAAVEKPSPIGDTPALAAAVSGKVYQFPRNALAMKSLSMTFVGPDPRYELEFYNRNPAQPPERFSGALGLDGRYRKGMDTPFGSLAVKGHWLDDHTFEVERLNLGGSAPSRKWTLSFDGDTVALSGKDFTGADVVVAGRGNG